MVGKAQKSHEARSELNSVFGLEKVDRCKPIRISAIQSSRWSVVRSSSLAEGGTSKKRPSPHLHKVPIQSNKMIPRTSKTAFVYVKKLLNKSIQILHTYFTVLLKQLHSLIHFQ
jgi:hypothetical protein